LDLFSKDTLSVLLDVRLAVANGHTSFVNGGFGKTRFQGNSNGGYSAQVLPAEADIVWNPRFTNALSANISAAWQRDHDTRGLDLMEAFLNYLPGQTGQVGFSGRAGFMWPEISLEHSTGGAWSVVNTITPSAINAWVGEEVKVIGAEATLRASIGEHDVSATGGMFGWNDTSGTLLSFRGWAWTLAARAPINSRLTTFIEALNVESRRGTRVDLGGLTSPFENQMVFQVALRARL
jgi:hypothetical protein